MLEFELARQRILEQVTPLGTELIPVDEADGRVLGEDLLSHVDLPPFDYSAMDGYAVVAAGFQGAGPWELPVAFEQRAGASGGRLTPGSVARIFTGASLPEGADAIVMQEDTEKRGERVLLRAAPRPGNHVRRRGEDLAQGAIALTHGTRLNPFRVGLVAALAVALDGQGYVKLDAEHRTSIQGIHAAGDRITHYHGALSAAASGSMAAHCINHELTLALVGAGVL